MFIKKSFLLCVVLISVNSHCLSGRFSRFEVEQENVQDEINNFGIKLNKLLVQKSSQENVVFSPIGAYVNLAHAHLGSGGNTRSEIGSALGIPNDESYASKLHDNLGELLKKIRNSGTANVSVESGIFAQNDARFKNSYLEQMLVHYDSQVINMDFTSSDACDVINKWFSGKTNGKINQICNQQMTQDTKLVLTNAFYFDCQWEQTFSQGSTTQDQFRNDDQQTVSVKMMRQKLNIPHYKDEKNRYEAIALPYQGGEYQLYIILPKEGENLKDWVSRCDVDTIRELLRNVKTTRVDVKLPKFDIQANQDLTDIARQLGVNQLFDKPDLSNMVENSNLRVSRIQHAADVDVNEQGSRISSGTSQEYKFIQKQCIGEDEKQFYVQRPFAYFLYNTRTNSILCHGNTFKMNQK